MVRSEAKVHDTAQLRFCVSLFTGAMGLDLGVEQAGFKTIVCNEIAETAIATIRLNRPYLPVVSEPVEKIALADLTKAAGTDLRDMDIVIGGPPCQAFSVFGQRRGIEDSRGKLVFEFIRLISEIHPKVFIMENVRGLHSMPIMPNLDAHGRQQVPEEWAQHGSLLREILRRFEKIGYRVDCFLVNVVNYGGPQIRERLICIGNRFNLIARFPQPQYSNRLCDQLPAFRTLRDAIGEHFHDPDPSLMDFSPRKLKYLSMVPAGGNWRSLPVEIQKESMGKAWYLKGGRSAYWRKLHFDFPSPTVITMPNHAGTSMCHPTEVRALTVGEMAAIQEFPRSWRFSGSPTDKCRQVGNAVPPRLGLVAGQVAMELLNQIQARKRTKNVTTLTPSSVQHIRPHVRTRSFYKKGKALAGNHGYYDGKQDDQATLF